jgi:hypothetical protein
MTWHPITTVPLCVVVRAWHFLEGEALVMFFGPDAAYTHWRDAA